MALTRRELLVAIGGGLVAVGAGAERERSRSVLAEVGRAPRAAVNRSERTPTRVAGDPTALPPPIRRDHPIQHEIVLEADEIVAEITAGVTFRFMTFGGRVPGPMIRVRRGDTVTLTLKSLPSSINPHNIDLHAVYGSGGGAPYSFVLPRQNKAFRFKAVYPGAFIYHCAVPDMDYHISSGMFGMIVVEPERGLPPVSREFYIAQHEIYTALAFNEKGLAKFDFKAMAAEQPSYVVFNGTVGGLTAKQGGAMKARVGEKVRIFMVNGGPNLLSSFHPIGNVWTRAWPQGALANRPLRFVQTQPVAPGSTFVGDMDLPVPETIKLVDHALSRVVRKGLMAEIEVSGEPNPDVFEPLGNQPPSGG
jgi:nitrite reductase (NO-forming)